MSFLNLKNFGNSTIIFFLLFVSACTESTPPFNGVKIGKPYQINGKTYNPASDSTYDKIGDASWYGPGFHGKRTASGEVFDQNDLTAAHPTLPMPSLVKVTNLTNNKSIVVRVNDRGPFHANRIIDLSKKAAQAIDAMTIKKVRVQFLAAETEEYIASITGKSPRIDMVEYNKNYNQKILDYGNNPEIGANSGIYSDNSEVKDYAPVQSVSSVELEKPEKPEKTEKQPVKDGGLLISDARASEVAPKAGEVASNDNTISEEQQEKLYRQATGAPEPASTRKSANKKVYPQEAVYESKPVVINSKPETKNDNVPAKAQKNEKFIIAAGSYSSQDNAVALAKSINSANGKGKIAAVDSVNVDGKKWWRVHVGPFTSREKAEQVLDIVHEKGVGDALVVRQK